MKRVWKFALTDKPTKVAVPSAAKFLHAEFQEKQVQIAMTDGLTASMRYAPTLIPCLWFLIDDAIMTIDVRTFDCFTTGAEVPYADDSGGWQYVATCCAPGDVIHVFEKVKA